MKTILTLIVALCVIFSPPVSARDTLIYNATYVTVAGVAPPTTPITSDPWVAATFTNLAPNVVRLKLASNLVGDEFVSRIVFNFDPTLSLDNLSFVNVASYGDFLPPTIAKDENEIIGGSGTEFDIGFSFSTSNIVSHRFNLTDALIYDIMYNEDDDDDDDTSYTSFTIDSFNFFDSSESYKMMALVQAIGENNTSAWIAPAIPEPTPIAMIIGSLCIFHTFRRQR